MVGSGKIAGFSLMGVAVVVEALAVLWLFGNVSEEKLQPAALILGLGMATVLSLLVFAAGGFLALKGRQEAAELAEVEKERTILNMVQTQGKVKISDIALQMQLNREQVKNYIYDLVGKGLFTGYINWNDGVLVSRQASEMQTTKCPNCGGEREVVGKGVVKCPYCGSELFV
ncbi:MAG: PCI domain-containing protein [Chloroflexi bacterium]|nr:PCI domain-containing protein [Chloroflexota bacterium]